MSLVTETLVTIIRKFILSTYLSIPALVYAQGYIENPGHMSYESGVGIISGFHCTADKVKIIVDDREVGLAYVGTNRADAKSLCGKEEVGFAYLINFNSLSPGEHKIKLLHNDVMFATATFFTKRSGGQEFAKGLKRRFRIDGFPSRAQGAEIVWVESKQNFVISKIESIIPERDITVLEKNELQQEAVSNHILPQLDRPETFRLVGTPVWSVAYGEFKNNYTLNITFSHVKSTGSAQTVKVACFATWTSQGWGYARDTCFVD